MTMDMCWLFHKLDEVTGIEYMLEFSRIQYNSVHVNIKITSYNEWRREVDGKPIND
jgi:hypothetical protein